MRRKDESKKPIISDFINAFYYEHDKVPSVREIVEGTGIPLSTVHRYLRDMQEKGELSYNGYRKSRPFMALQFWVLLLVGLDKSSGKRRQSISICYDFVGFIPLDELMKQETA